MKLTLSATALTAAVPDTERMRLLRETIRAELAARGVVTRRWLVARVIDVLQVFSVTDEEVSGAIDDLEDADDLVSGSHGRIAPTPLRVVDVGDGHLVVGTLPSVEWRHAHGPMLDEGRLPRRLSVHDDGLSDVARFGGLRMALARWAGLDRVAPANESWVGELDARLAMAPRPASDDNDSPWLGFSAAAIGPFRKRWRISSTDGGSKLWRRFHRAGYGEHAWTNGSSPSASPWVPLSGDEALRSIYSLTRAQPAELTVSDAGVDGTGVRFSERVPHAEYRWLVGAATSVQDGTFLFSTTGAAAACAMVRERLGIAQTGAGQPPEHPKTEH